MKSALIFRDQISILSTWFDSWNTCEQTVSLYTMFRKLNSTQLSFLLQVLQQSAAESTDTHGLEAQANNPVFVSKIYQQPKDIAIQQLLECLPLLKMTSYAAKAEYLHIIPKILSHSTNNLCNIEESRQLLSYTLIHPAINAEERSHFHKWLAYLDERQSEVQQPAASTSQRHHHPAGQDNLMMQQQHDSAAFSNFDTVSMHSRDSQQLFCDNASSVYQAFSTSSITGAPVGRAITSSAACCVSKSASCIGDGHRKSSSHSAPITPPNSNVSDWLNRHHEGDDLDVYIGPTSSSSQHSGSHHAPLSPQSSISSSGSESHDETLQHQQLSNMRNSFLEEGSGMKEVPAWLKGLRLHKYATLFQQLSYDEMLSITEEWLEGRNVTKGARHKIAITISKLRERQNHLRQLERDIMDCCNMRQAIQEVKSMMNTPIKRSEGVDENRAPPHNQQLPPCDDDIAHGDLPGQITRLMGKVCTQLLVSFRPEDDCFGLYLQLVDRCKAHEAWTMDQKKKLTSWKQQIQKTWHPSAFKHAEKKRQLYTALSPGSFARIQRPVRGVQQLTAPVGTPKWTFGSLQQAPTAAAMMTSAAALGMPLYRNNSFNTALNSRPALYELQAKQSVSKTNSVPLSKANIYGFGLPTRTVDLNVMEPEIAARLDSLCLSMTEHALGNLDSPEKGSTL